MTPTPYEYQQHRVGAINRANVAQIPDAANSWMTNGRDPPPELEEECRRQIEAACDQLRPAKERPAKAVETTIIRIAECGL
jgi:hypothetical protein